MAALMDFWWRRLPCRVFKGNVIAGSSRRPVRLSRQTERPGFRLLCYAMPSGVAQPKYRIKPAFFSTGPVHQGLRVRASREFLFSFRQLLTAGGNRQSCT